MQPESVLSSTTIAQTLQDVICLSLFTEVLLPNGAHHAVIMAISSLFDTALRAVMRDFHHHEPELRYLPSGVKGRVARVMAKRGLMNERNMELVSESVRDGPEVWV